jgi:hypothetical protein
MTNVEKLKKDYPSALRDIRMRLGSEDGKDDSYDEQINCFSPEECVAKLCGWYLGDESWAEMFIRAYKTVI